MFWWTLATQLLGLIGFGLILLQGLWDLHWRRKIEAVERRIDKLESQSATGPAAASSQTATEPAPASAAGRQVLDEVKAQMARYRPLLGRAFIAGALLLILSYLIRIVQTLTT